MNTPSSDHRKGCQCQTCMQVSKPGHWVRHRCGGCGAEADTRDAIKHWNYCEFFDKSDAAQGGVTTNPDGSIEYRHVPIVDEKDREK